MKKIVIPIVAITVIVVAVFVLKNIKIDAEPVINETIAETDDQQEVEEENIVDEVENIIEEEPEQEVEEVDTIESEDSVQEIETDIEQVEEIAEDIEESTGIVIVEELDQTLYAQSNCNGQSGDGTNYDIITTVEKGAQLHVTGLTENDWYRVQWGDGELYISSSLLATTPPSTSSSTNTGSSDDSYGFTQQELQRIDDILKQFSEENGGGAVSNGPGTSWNID